MEKELKRNAKPAAFASQFNALRFMIGSVVKGMVSTAIPVRVDAVELAEAGAGYVDVTPLICQTDADGNALPNVTIPHLPFFRLQRGAAAIICDPKPGDIGIAVFAQQDCSRLTGGTTPVAPATFRSFDMSDGFYLGGFWGPTPTTLIHLDDDETTITVTAPQNVIVNTTTATVNASGSVEIDSPNTNLTGNLTVQGHITGRGGMAISGGQGAAVTGNITVTSGDVKADGIGLKSHVHQCPDGTTSTGQG